MLTVACLLFGQQASLNLTQTSEQRVLAEIIHPLILLETPSKQAAY